MPENIEKIVIVASGSSYHCARFSADLLGEIAGIEARAIYSSEFNLKKVVPHDRNTLYIFITQSGETTDTLTALRRVNEGFTDNSGEKYFLDTLCITNRQESTIWGMTKYKIDCSAGVENAIAATKSFTAQMLCVLIVALKLSKHKGGNIDGYLNSLDKLPSVIKETFSLRKKIKHLARLVSKQHCVVITADGISYSIAKEAALKIKETSYMNINATYLGEFMHGHVAVLNSKKSLLIYMTLDKIMERSVNNLNKIIDDYHPYLVIIGKPDERVKADLNIYVECQNEIQQLFANVVISQLIALETALSLGRNVDHPKGLHKVVVDKAI